MKVIDKINGSGLFAQSAFSASTATKDSLGRDITATYLTGVNIPESATWNETSNVVSSNSAKWSEGKTYEGISPIVVNNTQNKISADTWVLSAGDGVSLVDFSADRVTRIDVTAQGGDEGVNSFVHDNSATILDVNSSYQANSGNFLTAIPSDVATTGDVANLEQTISETYYPKSNPSSFATESWVNGQGFLTAHQDISNKLDTTAFSTVSGDFLTTSFSIPESATWNDTSNVVQTNSAQWAEGDDEGVNLFVTENSASIIDVNNSYKANSGNFLTAIPSDVATKGDVDSLAQSVSDTYYPKSNPSSFATESWVTAQGYLTAHQDISNKLDSSAFSSVSGDFLTTSFSIPESAVWNDTSNVVQTNSAQWGQGGGGSVSSKYGTISVDGSNIEATNKAIEFNSNGFTSSFDGTSVSNTTPVVLTWDNYSQGTSITAQVFSEGNEDATLTYSSNTNVTGEVTGAPWNIINLDVQIPNATAIQFTTDKNFRLQGTRVYAPSSFKVSELAWKSDLPTYEYDRNHKLSAINGSALVGNEDYLVEQGFVHNLISPKGTIKVLNNNKIEGTNSAIASDAIEGFVSSYNGVSVYPEHSATLTWDRYVPNTMLFVSGAEYQEHTLTYSANTDVTGVITTTTGGQISIELPTDSTSIVIGNENWGNTTYNFTVSAADYYQIGELAWASAIPTYEYDSTNKISAINGSAIAGGGDVPSGTMNVSGLEYNAVNEISAYNGSAIAQPTLSSLNTANVNNIIVTASLPSTTDANTLYLIPEA